MSASRSLIKVFQQRIAVWCLLLLFVLPAACSGLYGYRGRQATETPHALPPAGASAAGSWQTREMRLDYRMEREGANIQVSGTVNPAGYLQRGFQSADWLVVRMQFLDDAQQILNSVVLLNTGHRSAVQPWPFTLAVSVPDGSTAVSFSYWGQLSSGGTRGKDRIEWPLWEGP